jgi:hypothetical protein
VTKWTVIPELPNLDELLDLPDIASHEQKVDKIREVLKGLKAEATHTIELIKTKRA